jgi:hypothetical protein
MNDDDGNSLSELHHEFTITTERPFVHDGYVRASAQQY